MSDCGYCIDVDCDAYAEFQSTVIRKARKPFKCGECGREFGPKTEYEYSVGKWDGDFSDFKTCLDCMNIREAFRCGGYALGGLWEELEQYGFPDGFSEACVAKVETASAKQYLVDRWRKWKGLTSEAPAPSAAPPPESAR